MKERILKTTMNLYANYGIKGVSMSQIAGALQMSKKTLYAEFGNKEQLLNECIDYEAERLIKILKNTEQETENPVQIIAMITSKIFQYNSNYCPAFGRDITQFQSAYNKLLMGRVQLIERYKYYFKKGVDEGYYQPDQNYEVISSLIIEQSINKHVLKYLSISKIFLQGMCTPKGKEALRMFMPDVCLN